MKTLWVLFIGVLSLNALAQGAPKCEDKFKVFEGKYYIKDYNDAYAMMADLRTKCPKVDANLYVYGETILKYKIEVATLPEDKKPFINDLIALYNEQSANFPAGSAQVKKTLLQYDNKLIKDDEAYKAFDTAFTKDRQSFSDYYSLGAYFNLLFEQFKAGKGISNDQYLEKYGAISSQADYARVQIGEKRDAILKKQQTGSITDAERQYVEEAEPEMQALDNFGDAIRKQSKDYISCDKMEAYYGKGFDDHVTDYVWIETMVDALFGKKCYKSTLLQKGAVILNAMKPTKESAHRLGVIAFRNNDAKEGVKYYEMAASLEQDPIKKAKIYYEIANAVQNLDKALTKSYIQKTVQFNPKQGEAYLLLAEMYASVTANDECKLTDFERSALNFLAIDTLKKAEAANAKLKSTVDAAIKRYSKNLPTKDQAKALGKKKGDAITYSCWINESIILPSL